MHLDTEKAPPEVREAMTKAIERIQNELVELCSKHGPNVVMNVLSHTCAKHLATICFALEGDDDKGRALFAEVLPRFTQAIISDFEESTPDHEWALEECRKQGLI